MPRQKISQLHPKILAHIVVLTEHGFSVRQIAEMVSEIFGVKISHTTIAVYLKELGFESLHEPKLYRRDDRICPECSGPLQNALMPDEVCCSRCGLTLKEREAPIISLKSQIEQYHPENHISFQPLGQGNPDPLLIHAINNANPKFGDADRDYKEFMNDYWTLKKHVAVDERLRKLKDMGSKRLSELGFNKSEHYVISDGVGKLLEKFYEHYLESMLNCLQVKQYSPIVDSAIMLVLERFLGERSTHYGDSLHTDSHVKSLLERFLARRVGLYDPVKECLPERKACTRQVKEVLLHDLDF